MSDVKCNFRRCFASYFCDWNGKSRVNEAEIPWTWLVFVDGGSDHVLALASKFHRGKDCETRNSESRKSASYLFWDFPRKHLWGEHNQRQKLKKKKSWPWKRNLISKSQGNLFLSENIILLCKLSFGKGCLCKQKNRKSCWVRHSFL